MLTLAASELTWRYHFDLTSFKAQRLAVTQSLGNFGVRRFKNTSKGLP
jgi:hypothetical protein